MQLKRDKKGTLNIKNSQNLPIIANNLQLSD